VVVISGVAVGGKPRFDLFDQDMTGTEMIWFLGRLLEEIPVRVLVLWDNGWIHGCVELNTFVWLNRQRLELRRLPRYAPQLNPDEGIWDVIKNDKSGNYCPKSLGELQMRVEVEFRIIKRSPHRVQNAMRQSKLDW
jgi:putative transposase